MKLLHCRSVALVFLFSCTADIALPNEASIACNAQTTCPQPWVCIVSAGFCVQPGAACVVKDAEGYIAATNGTSCTSTTGDRGVCVRGRCSQSICGDSVIDSSVEECDNGDLNADAADMCRTDCTSPTCGDGIIDTTEICDDGNTIDNDACRANCQINVCGDGILNTLSEQCDDGNTNPFDACNGCVENVCGDGLLNQDPTSIGYEDCEDAGNNPNNGCDDCRQTRWQASVVSGLGPSQGRGLDQALAVPTRLAVSANGTLYIGTRFTPRVFRVDPDDERISKYAGSGVQGVGIDKRQALATDLETIAALSIDRFGALYISDYSRTTDSTVIRKLDPNTGILSVVVGGGPKPLANNELATNVLLRGFCSTIVDKNDDIILSTSNQAVLFKVAATTQNIQKIAGGGTADPVDGGSALDTKIIPSNAITLDSKGKPLLVASIARIFRLELLPGDDPASATLTLLAGTGLVCSDPLAACGDGGPAIAAQLGDIVSIAYADNTLYIYDYNNFRLRRVDMLSGIITTMAGTGVKGFSGDGGPAIEAELSGGDILTGIATGISGDVFITDNRYKRVRRIDSTGIISTVVGNGAFLHVGENTPALSAALSTVHDLLPLDDKRLLFTQSASNRLRLLSCDSFLQPWTCTVSTVAGDGTNSNSGDGGLAKAAQIWGPRGLIRAPNGNFWMASSGGATIREIGPIQPQNPETWTINTIVGTGVAGSPSDGSVLTAQLNWPDALATDGSAYVYISDIKNYVIRRVHLVDPEDRNTWTIATVVGDGTACDLGARCSGDGGPALTAQVRTDALALDALGRLYITDSGSARIRRVTFATADPQSGNIETFAGTGVVCDWATTTDDCGDGGLATAASLSGPLALAVHKDGGVFFASRLSGSRLRYIDSKGIITSLGTADSEDRGDFGPVGLAAFREPWSLAIGSNSRLFIGGRRNIRYLQVEPGAQADRTVRSLAGDFLSGDGDLSEATLDFPTAIIDISDLGDGSRLALTSGETGRVQLLNPNLGQVSTLFGFPGSAVDHLTAPEPAQEVQSRASTAGLAYDRLARHLFFSNDQEHIISRIDLSVQPIRVEVFAGKPNTAGYNDDGNTQTLFNSPSALVWHSEKNRIYVADTNNHVVRAIDVASAETTLVAGTPKRSGFYGENTPAVEALLNRPSGLLLGPSETAALGSLYIADTGNHRVRRLDLDSGLISTVLGTGTPGSIGDGAPAYRFAVDSPTGLSQDNLGNLFVSSRSAIRRVAVTTTYVATGEGGVKTIYGTPGEPRFPEALTRCLSGQMLFPSGSRLWVLDRCAGLIVELRRQRTSSF